MSAPDDALAAWHTAQDVYEDGRRDEALSEEAFEALRDALFQAELAFKRSVDGLIAEARGADPGQALLLLAPLRQAIAGLIAIEEHAALEEERTARHGELAGAGHTQRERIGQLELARDELVPGNDLSDVLETLEELT